MEPAPVNRQREGVLDGLRGLAVLMVVLSHASGMGMDLGPGLTLTGVGKHGVYLFFVLSAYLLTRQWLAALPCAAGAWRRRLADYALSRIARIFPLYAAVLVVALLLGGPGLGVPIDARAFWQHLLLLRGDGIYWSIPVEFQYYVCLPLVALLLHGCRRTTGKLVLALALLLLATWVFPPGSAVSRGDALGPYLVVFLIGSTAAALPSRPGEASATAPPARRLSVWDGLLLCLLVLTIPGLPWPLGVRPSEAYHQAFIAWGLAWSATLLALLHGWLPAWRALLESRPMRMLGRWSFGIYLLHVPALHVARLLPLPSPAQGWLALLLSLCLGALSFVLIEAPALRTLDRFRRRRV